MFPNFKFTPILNQEPKSGTSCTIWLAVLFFLCDVAMIVSGALLLILNYHGNVITGFVLLGLGTFKLFYLYSSIL